MVFRLALVVCLGVATVARGYLTECYGHYYEKTSTPLIASVFTSADYTYVYEQTLTPPFQHGRSDTWLTGDHKDRGYRRNFNRQNNFAASPNINTAGDLFNSPVNVAANCLVIYSPTATFSGAKPATSLHAVQQYESGYLATPGVEVLFDEPDRWAVSGGTWSFISSDATGVYLFDPVALNIRRYETSVGDANFNVLTYDRTIVPSRTDFNACRNYCYGRQFAVDGQYFYIPVDAESSGQTSYIAFLLSSGTSHGLVQLPAAKTFNSLFFDWSTGRYSTFDAWSGNRREGTIYTQSNIPYGDNEDSVTYMPVSTAHTLTVPPTPAPTPEPTPTLPTVAPPEICASGLFYAQQSTDIDYSTVFNSATTSYKTAPGHVSMMTHRRTGTWIMGGIVDSEHDGTTVSYTGSEGLETGIYRWPQETDGFPADPTYNTTSTFGRMVHLPGACMVIGSIYPWNFPVPYYSLQSWLVSRGGNLVENYSVTFHHGWYGSCNLMSSTANEWLCFDGSAIRVYPIGASQTTQWITMSRNVVLDIPETMDTCSGKCFGGTFAVDGTYAYFAENGGGGAGPSESSENAYHVFDFMTGAHVARVTTSFPANAYLFDWSSGRYYSYHAAAGRLAGEVYYPALTFPAGSESHTFTDVSPYHSPVVPDPIGILTSSYLSIAEDQIGNGLWIDTNGFIYGCNAPFVIDICHISEAKWGTLTSAKPTEDDLVIAFNDQPHFWVSASENTLYGCGFYNTTIDICAWGPFSSRPQTSETPAFFFDELLYVGVSGDIFMCGVNVCKEL